MMRVQGPVSRPGTIAVVAVIVSCGAAIGSIAQQADRTKTEALASRATERLQALQREADQLASEEKTLLNELRRLELERRIKTEELQRVNGEAAAVAQTLAATTDRIGELERQDFAERPDLRARLVEMYKLGRARYLRLLLSTSDVRQLARATRLVGALARMDRERVAAHQRTIASLKSAQAELEERSRRLQSLRLETARTADAAVASARARSDLIHDIDRRRDLNAQLANELQAAQQRLQTTLRELSSGAPVAEPAQLPLRPFRGALEWPVVGPIRSRFGRAGGAQASESAGIEIAANEGIPVSAIHDGTIAFADAFSGFGNLVILDHGARTFSLYGDLLEIGVKRGARVERGQTIGRVGTGPTGIAGLYFELRVDGQPVDPLQWLKKR